MLQTALHFSHQLLKEVVEPGDFVIDATMGNGHDTAFLAELVGPSGEVFAFDIQKEALINTEQKLTGVRWVTASFGKRKSHYFSRLLWPRRRFRGT